MTKNNVQMVQRSQPDVMHRIAGYLDNPGFDPRDRDQIVGVTYTEEHRIITGAIALRFPPDDEKRLDISFLKTQEQHEALFEWATRTARMVGRPLLRMIVEKPAEASMYVARYDFREDGTPLSLLRDVKLGNLG